MYSILGHCIHGYQVTATAKYIQKCIKITTLVTSGRKKADIILETTSLDHPISIKKDNAEIWEYAGKYLRSKLLKKPLKNVAKNLLVKSI